MFGLIGHCIPPIGSCLLVVISEKILDNEACLFFYNYNLQTIASLITGELKLNSS